MQPQITSPADSTSVIQRKPARSPALLVLGAGQAPYGAPGLQEIASEHRVLLLDTKVEPWAAELAHAHHSVDLHAPDAVTHAVKQLADHHRIAGVLTYQEDQVIPAAQLADMLGVPGPSPTAATACRDKDATRRLLAAHRVPSPRHTLARTLNHAIQFADEHGYPVIVKPRALAGSVAVRMVNTSPELAVAYQAAAAARLGPIPPGVLVEELLDGPEISIECAVTGDGSTHVVAVTRKILSPEPHFEEVAHVVDAADPLTRHPAIRTLATEAAAAIGYRNGMLHIEARLTSHGWSIVEINGRLAGDLIPHLVHLATGISLPRAAARIALGGTPDLTSTTQRAAGIAFCYPHRPGHISDLLPYPEPHPPWLERQVWTRAPGDRVAPPAHGGTLLDRLGHCIVTAPDAGTCRRRLATVSNCLEVRITHPQPAPHG